MGLFSGKSEQTTTKENKKIGRILVNTDTFDNMTQYGNLYIGKEYLYVDTLVVDATKKITEQDSIHETYRVRKDKIQSVFIEQKEVKIVQMCNLCIVTSGKIYRVLYNTGDVYEAYNALDY